MQTVLAQKYGKRPEGTVLTLGGLELGKALVTEAIPDVTQKIAASRLGVEELLVLIVGELEVAVDIAASETQVQDAALGVVRH